MNKLLDRGEYVIGVDIGATKILALVLNRSFKVVGQCRKRIRTNKSSERAEDRVVKVIREALANSKVGAVAGIGVGSPGPLDPDTGVIIDTPNLAWKNFPLGPMLAETFGVPTAVDNDVNMGTYGEWNLGQIKKCQNVLGIFPGTGIGGGLIVDGKLYRGFTGAAGEVGHMTVEVGGPYCGCGKRGCLEAVASRMAIAQQVAALAARGDAPYIFSRCGADLTKIRSGMLVRSIQDGDTMVEGVVRKAAYYVGIAVGNLVNVLSPEVVILGGGLVEAMTEIYLEEVKRAMKDHAMPFLRKRVRVLPAALGDNAVALGAGVLIVEKLKAGDSAS